jgi:hypothetical protein
LAKTNSYYNSSLFGAVLGNITFIFKKNI